MTDDRSFERIARSWIESGPTRAPGHAIEAVLLTIETTPQERDFRIPRRLPIMNTYSRFAAAAAIVVLAVGGAAYLLRPATSGVGTGPEPTPSASPSPSAAPTQTASPVDAIPEGTYAAAPMHVADILALINADGRLSAAQKKDLIDNALAIRNHTTFAVSIDLRAGQWTQRQIVDGAVQVGSRATYSFLDANTVVLREPCCGLSGFQIIPAPNGFSLKSLTQAPDEETALAGRILFESGPFTLVP